MCIKVKYRVRKHISYLPPDQLKYFDMIVPQEENKISATALTMNRTAHIVGNETFEVISRRTSAMVSE